jgi:hypothetical protein
MEFDYTRARPAGSVGEYEKVISADSPLNEDGSYAGPPDVFKLEYSGWTMHVEFAPK